MEEIKMVFITTSGKKYHFSKNCPSLNASKNLIQISLIEAEKKNKGPCKNCCFNNNNKFKKFNFKNFNNNYYQQNQKFKNYKNKKEIKKNFINSDDADNEIFNSSSKLEQESMIKKDIQENNNNIINNISKNIDNEEDKKESNNIIKEDNSNFFELCEKNQNNNIFLNKNELNDITITSFSINIFSKNNNDSFNESKSCEREKDLNSNKDKFKNNSNESYKISLKKDKNDNTDKIGILKEKDKNKNKNNNHQNCNNKKQKNQMENQRLLDIDKNYFDSEENSDPKSKKKTNISEKIDINPININQQENYMQLYQLNQLVSLKKKDIDYNNYNLKLNCHKNDMYFLLNTFNNATLLSFEKPILFDKSDNRINGNGLAFKDSYMFKFEIIPLKEENNSFLTIEVGFNIKYINIQDMNLIIDEKFINKENINFKIGSLYDSLKIKKKLIIFKKTGIIYTLINIDKGKFFITGQEELEKRKFNIILNKANTKTFFIKNFFSIMNISLKNIEPIFNFDKNDLKNYDIIINDKKIEI